MKSSPVQFKSAIASHCLRLCLLFTLLFWSICLYAQIYSDSTQVDSLKKTEKRREPVTLSGKKFSRNALIRSQRELANIFPFTDTLTPPQKKTRTWIATGVNVIGYGGIMTALAAAWYDNYTKTKLHSFDDSREWLQVDKVGHFYGTWIESRANNELWKWTGMERKKRIWISGLTSFAFQTTIEYLDGRSAEWGWSWVDFGANILGSGSFIAQELAWDEQKIKLKWSFHRKSYNDASLNQRSDALFGKSTPERFLKDYNGQTYWASMSLKTFFPKSKLPEWLCISLGYGAEGMFGGTENLGEDDNGSIIFNRPDIKRYRQWYLAPDIDLTKIKTNKKGLRFLFTVLSAFKFPAPSLELSNGRLRLNALHF
jgi:uncharacterized protein YfiM (DUF2279 family)